MSYLKRLLFEYIDKKIKDIFVVLLGINDPLQTMDEINMALFTNFLKYDFLNKQLILSTHKIKFLINCHSNISNHI
jgi:hypothetical protein